MLTFFNLPERIVIAIAYVVVIVILASFLPPLVARMVVSAADARSGSGLSPRRRDTLERLSKSLTIAILITLGIVFTLSLFVNHAGLFTFLGLFSAAFGLGARPLVQDYISGFVFLFEDQYNVGEKVEIFGIEGTVIDVNLRTTLLRSPSGEVYIVPNGEVRVVRNFGRGEFSLASIRVRIPVNQLEKAAELLDALIPTLPNLIPELIEPPKIISEEGTLGEQVELTIFARAKFTYGVEARRKLLRIVHDALSKAEITMHAA
jgi:small conductance mechanosensitive channel